MFSCLSAPNNARTAEWILFNYTDDEGKIDPAQGKKAYGGVQVLIHAFLNLTKWKLITSPHEPL